MEYRNSMQVQDQDQEKLIMDYMNSMQVQDQEKLNMEYRNSMQVQDQENMSFISSTNSKISSTIPPGVLKEDDQANRSSFTGTVSSIKRAVDLKEQLLKLQFPMCQNQKRPKDDLHEKLELLCIDPNSLKNNLIPTFKLMCGQCQLENSNVKVSLVKNFMKNLYSQLEKPLDITQDKAGYIEKLKNIQKQLQEIIKKCDQINKEVDDYILKILQESEKQSKVNEIIKEGLDRLLNTNQNESEMQTNLNNLLQQLTCQDENVQYPQWVPNNQLFQREWTVMIHQAQRKIKGFASFQESINKSGFFSYDWENSEKFPSMTYNLGASIIKSNVNNDNKKLIYTQVNDQLINNILFMDDPISIKTTSSITLEVKNMQGYMCFGIASKSIVLKNEGFDYSNNRLDHGLIGLTSDQKKIIKNNSQPESCELVIKKDSIWQLIYKRPHFHIMDPKNADGIDIELNLTDEEIHDYYFYVCLTKKDDSVEITKKR